MRAGGAQKALLALAGWLHEQSIPVVAVFFYDKDNLHAAWQRSADFPIISLHAWSARQSWLNALRLLRGLFRLYLLMRQQRFQSIITYTEHANMLALPIAWLAGIPRRVATTRGRILGFKPWQGWLHARMINLGLATCLVANSQAGRQMSIQDGVLAHKVLVIPNGVEALEPNATTRQQVRQRLGIDDHTMMLLSAGRLTHEKGHDLLLTAARYVLDTCPQAQFVLAGDGILRSQHEAQAKQLGIDKRVLFLGFRQDVHDLMRAADIYVLPSRSEGMPNALLEAMQLGLPVAAFNVGGVGEIIQDGVAGLLAMPEDPQALASALIRLLEDHSLRQRLAQSARQHVRDRYCLEKMFQRYADLLLTTCPA